MTSPSMPTSARVVAEQWVAMSRLGVAGVTCNGGSSRGARWSRARRRSRRGRPVRGVPGSTRRSKAPNAAGLASFFVVLRSWASQLPIGWKLLATLAWFPSRSKVARDCR